MSLTNIKAHFEQVDPVIYAVLNNMPVQLVKPLPPEAYFQKLCTEIIGQQLAGKAADAIELRFIQLFDGLPDPQSVLLIEEQALRNVGMSWAKARSVKDLAEQVQQNTVKLANLQHLSNEAVISELVKVKGIGQWTAEMFLMFTLGREDVFSIGDLGLRKGIEKLYGFANRPTDVQIKRIVSKWTPYKTYASLALWQSVDG